MSQLAGPLRTIYDDPKAFAPFVDQYLRELQLRRKSNVVNLLSYVVDPGCSRVECGTWPARKIIHVG
jgi:hypothetical protein